MEMSGLLINTIAPEVCMRAARIKVLLMDVDGVLTDGRLFYMVGEDKQVFETKAFNSQDGLGLHFLNFVGIQTGVISGRESPAVVERAKILKMSYVYQGLLDKQGAFEEILKDACVESDEVAFIGDDFTDIPPMRRSGLSIAVANARAEVRGLAHLTTEARGGDGAVREVAEVILKSQDLWPSILAKYGLSGQS